MYPPSRDADAPELRPKSCPSMREGAGDPKRDAGDPKRDAGDPKRDAGNAGCPLHP
jgi:hypothetical protein